MKRRMCIGCTCSELPCKMKNNGTVYTYLILFDVIRWRNIESTRINREINQ